MNIKPADVERFGRGECVTIYIPQPEEKVRDLTFEYLGGGRWHVRESGVDGGVKLQPCKCRDVLRMWVCEYCGAVYGEYVNDCPKCFMGEVGTASKVVLLVLRVIAVSKPVWLDDEGWAWPVEVVKNANINPAG